MTEPITEPGIYEMSEQEYHAHPALSSTGARKLLPPSCPAKFAAWRAEPPASTSAMDLGSAAHRLILGVGPQITVIAADDWRTKAAKDARDEAHEAGYIPVLNSDWERINAMLDALRADPLASAALDPKRGGKPEQSLFWESAGALLRARLDWMPDPHSAMRPVIFDYKTTRCAEPGEFARSVLNFGYHVQAAFYADAYNQLTGVDAPFLFIAQEKEPPFLVTVLQPDAAMMRAGRAKYQQAVEVYRWCEATGEWPGYPVDETGIHTISLPRWAREEYE